MVVIGFKDWSHRSGGKIISGILMGIGILLMVWTSFLHKSTKGFVLGLALVVLGLVAALLASLTKKADRRR